MLPEQAGWTNLIQEIISKEMTNTDLQQYFIEGKEYIDNGFAAIENNQQQKLEPENTWFGISDQVTEALKISTPMVSLIASILSLYMQCKTSKETISKKQLDELEIQEKLREKLIAHNFPKEFIDQVEAKYTLKVMELVDKM